MYKVASDKRQSSLHRGCLADWVTDEAQWQSAEQRLRDKQDGILILEKRMLALPKGDERAEIGRQKLALQTEIKEFRIAANLVRQARRGFAQTFIDLAKEMLPKLQFELVYKATLRECDRAKRELAEAPIPAAALNIQQRASE